MLHHEMVGHAISHVKFILGDPVQDSKEDDGGVLPLELLQINDQQQIDRLMRQLSHSPDAILYFLQKHVFSNVMKHQSVKLQVSNVKSEL